mmetsp:Transcript_47239/g.145459  ORF Transcript_47239/g.145459 Transcript_47239/m.145459 type:complete len:225 (+) Transcript_47239:557-1231(+)
MTTTPPSWLWPAARCSVPSRRPRQPARPRTWRGNPTRRLWPRPVPRRRPPLARRSRRSGARPGGRHGRQRRSARSTRTACGRRRGRPRSRRRWCTERPRSATCGWRSSGRSALDSSRRPPGSGRTLHRKLKHSLRVPGGARRPAWSASMAWRRGRRWTRQRPTRRVPRPRWHRPQTSQRPANGTTGPPATRPPAPLRRSSPQRSHLRLGRRCRERGAPRRTRRG